MPVNSLDQATPRAVSRLPAAETDDFNTLVRLAGLDPGRDFRHTDMSGTSMVGADLRGFDFTGADFRNVDLDGARIDGACFKGADLSGTEFSKARGLEAADCSFAVFQDAPFAPEMVLLPAGSFLMGSPESEEGRQESEGPQRQVTVSSFAIGRFPVTRVEYERFREATSPKEPRSKTWSQGKMPQTYVLPDRAIAFVSWLSEQTGKRYRLPTEAEWEYACRAGTTTAFWWGDEFDRAKVNAGGGAPGGPTEVGSFPANPWGLFDTLGNVFEWVEDHWHDNYEGAPSDGRAWVDAIAVDDRPRVLRGGCWGYSPESARCAYRGWTVPYDYNPDFIGLRVVCSLSS